MSVLDLSAYKPVPGTLEDANQIANGFTAIQTCINALDNNNFAAGKIFDPTKLMQNAATAGQALVWDGASSTWKPGTVAATTYRKTTAKAVVNSVAETDLLNGEITIGAGVLGTTGRVRLTAQGDWINNTGGNQSYPRFKLKLGATTILDTSALSALEQTSASRLGWKIVVEIANLGAANSQSVALTILLAAAQAAASNSAFFSVGNGVYTNPGGAGNAGVVTGVGWNSSAVDTSLAQALVLSVINGVASASYDVTLRDAIAEVA